MTEVTRAAAKAEEVRQKMQTTFAISTNSSMSSSAEVDNILDQIKKEATSATKPKHMQVIGLEEEVRLKEVTIKGLYQKIAGLENQLCQSNEKITELEKGLENQLCQSNEKITELEKVKEENKDLKESMVKLKEKNTNVLQTAKEHQKGWKAHISKLEKKALEKESENQILRSKMAKLMRTLEGTIEEFSDLVGVETALSLASSSESEDEDTVQKKNAAHEDKRDVCEQDTKVEKGVAAMNPGAVKKTTTGFFTGLLATKE